jgi:DNA-binding MarR family transcriptional regulator
VPVDQPITEIEQCVSDVAACSESIPSACSGEYRELAGLEKSERALVLAALTARFSAAYLRWMRRQAGAALSFTNVRVLEILDSQGPTIMREIAASLGMTARNMTAIVDTLEEGRLVHREPHPHDRRATIVELTPAGAEVAAEARSEAAAWASEAFSSLTLEEQQQYAALLGRLSSFFCPER